MAPVAELRDGASVAILGVTHARGRTKVLRYGSVHSWRRTSVLRTEKPCIRGARLQSCGRRSCAFVAQDFSPADGEAVHSWRRTSVLRQNISASLPTRTRRVHAVCRQSRSWCWRRRAGRSPSPCGSTRCCGCSRSGFRSSTIRSASLPFSIDPSSLSSPRYFAPLIVAHRIASRLASCPPAAASTAPSARRAPAAGRARRAARARRHRGSASRPCAIST